MADFNASVALGVNSPDPQAGLNTLNKIMELGQRGLAIRGAQSENITKASQATIAQQNATENQNLAGLVADPVKNGILDENGQETPDAKKIILQAAPTTGAEHYGRLVEASQKKLNFNKAANDLRTSERAELASGVAGVASRADSPQDVTDWLDSQVESKKGTPEYGNYQTIANQLKESIAHTAKKGSVNSPAEPGKELWRQYALNAGSALLPPGSTVGPGGLANPAPQNTGAGVTNRNPVTGALTAPPGAAPGTSINPTPPQVAGATSRQVQGAAADIDRANQVSGSVQASSAAIPLTQHIDDLAEQIHSGKFAASISKVAAAVGISEETYARQVLEKELGQVKTLAIKNAPSDAAAATIQSGYPDATSDTKTIHTAMDYTRGAFRQNLARGDLLNKVKSKDESLRGFQHADDLVTGSTDPLMHEFKALKTPQERIGFYQRNFTDPAKAQEFRDKVAGMSHVIGQ